MDSKLNRIMEDNSSKFQDWIEIINDHQNFRFTDKNDNKNNFGDLTLKTVKVLGSISELFFKYGSFKDNFDNSNFYSHVYGPAVIIKSKKTDSTFNLGIDDRGIYLNVYLKYLENLGGMNDSFFKDVLQLADFGKFEFNIDGIYNSELTNNNVHLFNNKKSVIQSLLRNYYLSSIENNQDKSFGEFQLIWTDEDDIYDIILKGCLAFKIMYKLNYVLWKVTDLKSKRYK